MLQNLTTLAEWETVEEDMDKVGLAKIIQQVCHKKGAREKQQMLNLVQVTKETCMCCQQRDSVGTHHERFLATLEVAEAADIMIVRDVSTDNIVLKEWGLETSDPGIITKEKQEAAFAEGEKHFRAAMFFSGLSDHKYGEMKDNVHNSYLAGVNILPHTYDDVLRMVDSFKPTTACQHYSGGAQKDNAGVVFVSTVEVKEKQSAGMAKSPQIKAVVGVQKKDDGTIPLNEVGHRNSFHCGSNHHWACDCDQLSKTQHQ